MEEYVVDFSGVTDKESFHACLKKSLPLPEWYGENLDALYDSLTELDDACIYFKNCGQAAASLADYYNSFLNVIADAQMEVQGLFCFLEDKAGGDALKNALNALSADGEEAWDMESGEEDDDLGRDPGEEAWGMESGEEEDDLGRDPGEEAWGVESDEDDDLDRDPGEEASGVESGEDDDLDRDPDEE